MLATRLRRIQRRGGQFLGQVVQNDLVEMLHRGECEVAEVRSQVVPQRSFGFQLFPHRTKQRAAELLCLVHQESQHHQHGKHHRQVLRAVTKVVFKMVALVLQRVERFVFDLPTRTPTSDQMTRVVRSDRQIGDPTEAFANLAVSGVFGVL